MIVTGTVMLFTGATFYLTQEKFSLDLTKDIEKAAYKKQLEIDYSLISINIYNMTHLCHITLDIL
ncbi:MULTISPECIES: hypothetical protein [Terrisporobacter]|uniref:hypothetical protein n=1 Tax=Terrisporobacter TaxID=1505652 RepID=UPI0023F2942A|nr:MULTISPECIES: hypothetical protein [Terrisporobacter]